LIENVFILLDKQDTVVSVGWAKGKYLNNDTGEIYEAVTEEDRELGLKLLLNTPERRALAKNGGKILEVADTGFEAGDKYINGEHQKVSPLRLEAEENKNLRKTAKTKLKSLLNDNEIDALFGRE